MLQQLTQKINFYSGPAILPRTVVEQASEALLDFNGSGLSILEISHRSSAFVDVMEGARNLVRQLYSLPQQYEVLFLTGGASTQFALVPYNLLPANGTAAYLETGQWAKNAIDEARLWGNVAVAGSSAASQFDHIPAYEVPSNASYFHITTNNTIYGTQLHHTPQVACPLVADMSSDIFSRPLTDVHRYGLIYAGAQKNMGAAGAALVIVNKDLLGKTARAIPTMFDYQTHIGKQSMFNTPPVFAVYVSYLTLQWIARRTLPQIAADNQHKAQLLYTEIDRNSLFTPNVATADRSLMNLTFRATEARLEQAFIDLCTQNGIVGIKGYRTVGGFRASLYNAMDAAGVQTLVDAMQHFESKHG